MGSWSEGHSLEARLVTARKRLNYMIQSQVKCQLIRSCVEAEDTHTHTQYGGHLIVKPMVMEKLCLLPVYKELIFSQPGAA